MDLVTVRELYKNREAYLDKEVSVGGWVRSVRASKAFGFIVVSDGTYFETLQVVYHDNMANFAEISKLNVGAAIIVALVLVCVSPLIQRLARWALGCLPRTDSWQTRREKWLEQLDTLGTESRHLLADRGRCVQIFALHTLKLFLMYTLPYLCIRFMGLPCGLSFWQVQLLASLMLFLSNALPNVAGMGSIETAFLLVFGSFMTRGEAMSTLMLFRIASYYFVFGFSAVASLFAQKHLDRMDAQKRS